MILNDKKYLSNTIDHAAILRGGVLDFEMGPDPKNIFPPVKGDARLRVVNASVSKTKVEPHEAFRVYFNIRNSGSVGTGIVRLFVNGKLYDSINCLVPANGTVTDSITCRLYPYGRSVVKVDDTNEMALEVTRPAGNNPDTLLVTGLVVSPMLKLNAQQHMYFVAKNIGGDKREFKIPVLLNDSVIRTLPVTLGPGEEAGLSEQFAVPDEGFQALKIHGNSQRFKVYGKTRDAMILALDMMNVGKNGIIKDQSGWGNDGKVITTGDQTAAAGPGTVLLGDSCYIEVPNSGSLDVMNETLTMMAWVYPKKEAGGLVDLLTKGDNHVLQLTGNKLGFFAGGWGRGDCIVDLPADWVNNWHHVAGVCDGNSLKVYINGKLMGTTVLNGAVNLSVTSKWNVGRNEEFPGERIFHGYIERVRVFTEPLTGPEIASEIERGR